MQTGLRNRFAGLFASLLFIIWTSNQVYINSKNQELLAGLKNSVSWRNTKSGTAQLGDNSQVAYQEIGHTKPNGVFELGLDGRPKYTQDLIVEHMNDPTQDGSQMTDEQAHQYVESIVDLDNSNFWRVDCPGQHDPGERYNVLRNAAKADPGIKYLFALDLYNSIDILPRLLGSIVRVIKHIGVKHCALSIVEGRSEDGTYKVLHELQEFLNARGVRYWLDQSDINPLAQGVDRIAGLSELRNLAVKPMIENRDDFSAAPLLYFVNDIAVCPDDLLEMLYQHQLQGASQTCSMDWVHGGHTFYDSWVSRSMTGNTFFEIAQDMSWAFSQSNMFWDDRIAREQYKRREPLQVYSCWGGMTVLDARPFIRGQVAFRRNVEGECYGGEPQTLASDFAKVGLAKAITLPYVNVAYSDHEAMIVKHVHKYVHQHINVTTPIERWEDDKETPMIRWRGLPPRVRCMPSFHQQWWVDTVYTGNDEHWLDQQ